MIPEAREVRLSRNQREQLEARCLSAKTLQRDLKRAQAGPLARPRLQAARQAIGVAES
jgi:hypothetical protein